MYNVGTGILWCHSDSPTHGNVFKMLKHRSIITGCWDIHRSTPVDIQHAKGLCIKSQRITLRIIVGLLGQVIYYAGL